MRGLNFLVSRKVGESIDFRDIEMKYDISVPPIFQLFIDSYEVSELREDHLLIEKNNFKYNINGLIYTGYLDENGNDKHGFAGFLKPHQMFSIYESDLEEDEFGICSRKYIPFGLSGIYNESGGFMVGTVGEEQDKIIVDTESYNLSERFLIIEENIFEFVRKFEVEYYDLDYVDPNIDLSKLYKNWGEDYWRMRGASSVAE